MRYFRFYAESLDGQVGYMVCEVSPHNLLTRQIQVFGDQLFWASPGSARDERYPFTDQPEFTEGVEECDEIGADEFEVLWQRAVQQ
ncbi:MAG: hypothetical protein ACJ8GW_01695 [Massilia sp.]